MSLVVYIALIRQVCIEHVQMEFHPSKDGISQHFTHAYAE